MHREAPLETTAFRVSAASLTVTPAETIGFDTPVLWIGLFMGSRNVTRTKWKYHCRSSTKNVIRTRVPTESGLDAGQ